MRTVCGGFVGGFNNLARCIFRSRLLIGIGVVIISAGGGLGLVRLIGRFRLVGNLRLIRFVRLRLGGPTSSLSALARLNPPCSSISDSFTSVFIHQLHKF